MPRFCCFIHIASLEQYDPLKNQDAVVIPAPKPQEPAPKHRTMDLEDEP